jgi:hypothetical protein
VGADKCGTDNLQYHLNMHEEIYGYDKECNFFSQNNNYNLGINKYDEIFNSINKPIYGEKSPSYMFLKIAIDRIYENYPDVKIIISLREPVNRVYSSHNHLINSGRINMPFIQLINQNENLVEDLTNTYLNQDRNCVSECTLQRGYYINYIEYIYSTFPKENIYIGINEEFFNNPLEEYNKLFKFLGAKELSHDTFSLFSTTNVNKSIYKERITDEEFKYVYNLYKEYNERLYIFLGKRLESWDNIYKQRGLM